ncbi:hypothetical protein [Streptomyces sp. NPDC006551]|uniref:MmyB family transcriptional regulator n=1 Tax=Streptomyces sp. NPDC006551 TaxID=3157178 RepID=UPI0033B1D60E
MCAWSGEESRRPAPELTVGELSLRDPDFRSRWADHLVARRTFGSKTTHHPVAGDLPLDGENLTSSADEEEPRPVYEGAGRRQVRGLESPVRGDAKVGAWTATRFTRSASWPGGPVSRSRPFGSTPIAES